MMASPADMPTADIGPAVSAGTAIGFRNVGYWRAPPRHLRPRPSRNQAFNNLLDFIALFRSLPRNAAGSPRTPENTKRHLHDITVDIPRGAVTAVVDIGGEQRLAFTRLAAGIEAPRIGEVRYGGTVLGLDRAGLLPFALETVEWNLRLKGKAMGLTRPDIAEAIERVRSFPGMADLPGLPVHLAPKGMVATLPFAAACSFAADIVVLDDVPKATGAAYERWRAFLAQAPRHGTTVVMTARNLSTILPEATHLVLIEDAKLRAFGPAPEITAAHAGFIKAAKRTPPREIWQEPDGPDEPEDETGDGEEEDLAPAARAGK